MSLTQSNLQKLQSPTSRQVDHDCQSKSSYRSLRSSQQGGFYGAKNSHAHQLRSGISEGQKAKLHQLYSDMSAGKIGKDKFARIVKEDLNLRTNEAFDKSMGQVDFNYAEVVRGINKQYREENQNLKPNTCDPAIVTGYDLTLSVGKFQEKFLPVPNFEKSNEVQKKCLEEVNLLRKGGNSTQGFLSNLKNLGLNTDLIEKELRELKASNQASYSKISSGVFRALEQQRRENNDATAEGLNDHPVRADAACHVQAHDHRVYFAVPAPLEDKEQIYLDKQLRTLSYGNVYNELKRPAPEYVQAAKNNGDIFTWNERNQDSIYVEKPEPKRKDLKHNSTQISLVDPPAKNLPIELPSSLQKKIISQTTSSRNILAYESEPIVSPKKDLKMLNGNGDIITWSQKRR